MFVTQLSPSWFVSLFTLMENRQKGHFESMHSYLLQIRTEGLEGTLHAALARGINKAMHILEQCPSRVQP